MLLQIDDTMRIDEVQDRFQECFPYLQLRFYSKPHEQLEGSEKKDLYDRDIRIGHIRRKHSNGVMEIKSWDTTSTIERKMKEQFGLNIQIFRYDSIGCWIQTTFSDTLTLKQLGQFANGYLPGLCI